ncbi:MAG TPA: FkbM family methyltransferase [Chitinophagaceae bacterium]|jgi:FkbM family methyltransferase|nr:FkbM family methyltransferase [Chitinophagaceae bacterium]
MGILKKIRKKLFASEKEKTVDIWYKIDGENLLRLDYDNLNENSIVLDLGGYKGEWASHIYSRYLCTIFVFEPASFFYRQLKKRFERNPKIKVYPFGLGNSTQDHTIYLNAESTSIYQKKGTPEIISIKNYKEFLEQNSIRKVDLLKINIEGSEYDLLEFIIENNLVDKIENIQVQFHDFVGNAEARMKNIQEKLSLTHTITYQYKFVWENWKLKR